ncbi:MAG: MFS transporter [Granulosicoccaceae bacterium]|jgi:PPP family 3-phenylpropionic acid transporter
MSESAAAPYWRLSGFYLFYFATIGVIVPYWPLYLKSLSFSPREIGELMAVVMATKIIAPNIWGWIADHTGQRMWIVRAGSLLAILFFTGVFFGQSYLWMAAVMAAFSFFWNATLPQFEATTFSHLGDQTHRYSSIRLWGSIGFVIAAIGLGWELEVQGAGDLPVVLLGLFLGIWLISLIVPERAAGYLKLDELHLFDVLKRPEVLALIVIVFLMQLSHGPYYTFYTIYMEDHGYSRSFIGWLWALGVIAEIVVFLFMHRLIPAFGLRRLLLFSLAMAALRWCLLAWFVDSLLIMLLNQMLHAATFGVYHAAAIQYFHVYFRGRHQGRGQALYSSMSYGAGGALGALLSGYAWSGLGSTMTYLAAALISVLSIMIGWRYLRTLD